MNMRRASWWGLLGGTLAVTAFAIPGFAQQSGHSPDVLGGLLIEVRGLRAAIEHMSASAARVQLAMGRLQLQEQRITTMVRRLDAIRDQKTAVEREVIDLRERATHMEAAAEQADEPALRKEAAVGSAELRRLVSVRSTELQRLVGEEIEAANVLAAEQNRWTDINRTLEELERALMAK